MAVVRGERGRFVTGGAGPGRPIGSRSRLSETMLALLQADAAEHGAAVIAEVRQKDPSTWLRCMCSLLPRELKIEKTSVLGELTDEELQLIEETLKGERAQPIDGKAVEVEPRSDTATAPLIPMDATSDKP